MAKETKQRRERITKIEVLKTWLHSNARDVFTLLRMIHASWMLWLVAVIFTVIISPYMFLLYQSEGSFIVISVSICGVTWGGYALGKKFVNTFFKEEVMRKHELGPWILWLTRLSVIVLLIILAMDIASIAAESYFNGMIKQNEVYWASVGLLFIVSLSLWVSIISRWRNKGGV